MRRGLGVALAGLVLAACGAGTGETAASSEAPAAESGGGLRLVRVVGGLGRLTHVAVPRSEPGRLYVVQKTGRILVHEGGRIRPQAFLDIRGLVGSEGNEQGLLSVAFHPRYATNRRFYVDYTDRNGNTRVVEYRSNGRRALPATARRLLFVRQPYSNHNGGQLAFGPDGRLYVGMGDGGAGGDPENHAQNLASRLGKLLRIDPLRAGSGWEIVAYGLRNPWRFSFDRATGDIWIGDVGQNDYEEVSVYRSGRGLVNFEWDVREGRHAYEKKRLTGPGRAVGPVFEYSHDEGCSVTGGFVYRGSRIPALRGRYLAGDYCSGTIWSFTAPGGEAQGVRREAIRLETLTSFGEGATGELFLVSDAGAVYRLAG